jgi:hypothetical protein
VLPPRTTRAPTPLTLRLLFFQIFDSRLSPLFFGDRTWSPPCELPGFYESSLFGRHRPDLADSMCGYAGAPYGSSCTRLSVRGADIGTASVSLLAQFDLYRGRGSFMLARA